MFPDPDVGVVLLEVMVELLRKGWRMTLEAVRRMRDTRPFRRWWLWLWPLSPRKSPYPCGSKSPLR